MKVNFCVSLSHRVVLSYKSQSRGFLLLTSAPVGLSLFEKLKRTVKSMLNFSQTPLDLAKKGSVCSLLPIYLASIRSRGSSMSCSIHSSFPLTALHDTP
jgi:hypothetical protein